MIYLKGEGYAKGSAFGNPTIISLFKVLKIRTSKGR